MKYLIIVLLSASCSTVSYDTYMRNCVFTETYHTSLTSEQANSYCHSKFIKERRLDKPVRDR